MLDGDNHNIRGMGYSNIISPININVEFEWDLARATSNLAKHGIDFDDAAAVFGDPRMISIVDPRSDGETRYHAIERSKVAFCLWCTPSAARGIPYY